MPKGGRLTIATAEADVDALVASGIAGGSYVVLSRVGHGRRHGRRDKAAAV